MMSLPKVFGTTLATIPADIPYLHADPAEVDAWRRRLTALAGRKVGLVWAGSPQPEDPRSNAVDQRRSMTLADFAPLANVPDICLISLQVGEPAAQARTPPAGMTLHDWTNELTDFADTAALVEALDLVVSVDTSVVHLAGALGKPIWVLKSILPGQIFDTTSLTKRADLRHNEFNKTCCRCERQAASRSTICWIALSAR